jgi:hypothetical protein
VAADDAGGLRPRDATASLTAVLQHFGPRVNLLVAGKGRRLKEHSVNRCCLAHSPVLMQRLHDQPDTREIAVELEDCAEWGTVANLLQFNPIKVTHANVDALHEIATALDLPPFVTSRPSSSNNDHKPRKKCTSVRRSLGSSTSR